MSLLLNPFGLSTIPFLIETNENRLQDPERGTWFNINAFFPTINFPREIRWPRSRGLQGSTTTTKTFQAYDTQATYHNSFPNVYRVGGSQSRYTIDGQIVDSTPTGLPSVTVKLFDSASQNVVDISTTDSGGYYVLGTPYMKHVQVVAYQGNTPDIFSVSANNLIPGAVIDLNFVQGTYSPNTIDNLCTAAGGVYNTAKGSAVHANGLIQWFAANTPRITSQGLLVEGGFNNLIAESNFNVNTNAVWTIANVAITENIGVAPDNGTTAAILTETATDGTHSLTQLANLTTITAADTNWSVFVKPLAVGNSRNIVLEITGSANNLEVVQAVFCPANGAIISGPVAITSGANVNYYTATSEPYANNWWRFCLYVNNGATSANREMHPQFRVYLATGTTTSYTGDGVSGAYLWGAQSDQVPGSATTSQSNPNPLSAVNTVGQAIAASWPASNPTATRGKATTDTMCFVPSMFTTANTDMSFSFLLDVNGPIDSNTLDIQAALAFDRLKMDSTTNYLRVFDFRVINNNVGILFGGLSRSTMKRIGYTQKAGFSYLVVNNSSVVTSSNTKNITTIKGIGLPPGNTVWGNGSVSTCIQRFVLWPFTLSNSDLNYITANS